MYRKVKLTPAQEKHMELVRIAAMTQAPFFLYYFYDQMIEYPTLDMPTAATDQRRLYYNPEYLCGLSVEEGVFVFVHELYHAVQCHPARMKHYSKQGGVQNLGWNSTLFNVCADFIINADLVLNNIGVINQNWLYDRQVTGSELVEDLYVKYYKPPEKEPGPGGGPGNDPAPNSKAGDKDRMGNRRGPTTRTRPDTKVGEDGRFDHLEEPVVNTDGEADVPDEGEYREAILRAAAAAKQAGKMPGSMQRMIDEIMTPQVEWRDHIRMLLTGRLGRANDDWRRLNRRRLVLNPIVGVPGRRGYGAELVVIVIDNSGSISKKEYDAFFAEMGGILNDVKPHTVLGIWCDAAIRHTMEVSTFEELQSVITKHIKGGGGTDFHPPFEYITKHHLVPDTLVYLTDMMPGHGWPTNPGYPVVWCATTDVEGPFGDTVRIKV